MLYNPELQRQKHQQQQQQSSSSSSGGSNALKSFIYALKSSDAQKQYPARLRLFFNLIGLPGTLEEQAESFVEKSKGLGGGQWTQDCIINFVNHYKQRVMRKEIATGTLNNYYMAVKLFCEMNDLATSINWKRISRGLPRMKLAANDRAPTLEEIRKLVEYPDRRIKAIVYCMASGGFRIGSWEYLRWKHVTPITDKQDQIIAAKLIIYAEESEEYYTFITPEAYQALKTWMDFRASYGEKITGESWVIRDLWQTSNVKYGAKWGLATNPKKLQSAGIKKILNRALWEQSLRQPLQEGTRRHEYKSAHGFRKFFKTRAEQVMKPLNVELLLSHDSGISEFYYRPTESEVLQDYLKAVDLLTINDDKSTLQKQVVELTEKSEEASYIIKGKLAEKERQFEEIKERLDAFEQDEYLRKEHQAQLEDTIKQMISRMDSMIVKMYDVNPKIHSLPTKELEDTFLSIVEGKKKDDEEEGQQQSLREPKD